MTEAGFESTWRKDLQQGVTGVQLVEVDHPLEVYVGASELGNARFQIRSIAKPVLPVLADVVLVDRAAFGQSWVLTLTLQDARFREVFIRLASHVVARSRDAESEPEALKIVDQIIDQWRRMMTPRPSRRLSLEALRGLVGELWFLLHRQSAGTAFTDALDGWLGPLGEPQDFWSAERGFREVKSVGPSAPAVKISSAEQLDPEPMSLMVLEVPQVPEATARAETLVSLANAARDRLDGENRKPDDLAFRLERLGVDLTDTWYAEQWFRVDSVAEFRVSGSFPRIPARELPLGVGKVRYQIARSALEPYKQSFDILT